MEQNFRELLGESPHSGEVASWKNSIPTVVDALNEVGLGEVEVLLEMKTPLTDVRMDMVLVGSYPKGSGPSVVVVENKQWSHAYPVPDSELVSLSRSPGADQLIHPVNQVWGYRQVLADFVPLLRDAHVHCIVNMHNAPERALAEINPRVQGLSDIDEIREFTRVYGSDQRDLFKKALCDLLSPEDAKAHAQELLEAPAHPTEALLSSIGSGLARRSVFPLLDEQREAFDYVRAQVARTKKENNKEAVLIVGGPGTGKSVIALELYKTLSRQGARTMHATGSRAFTRTIWNNVQRTAPRAKRGFTYFNRFSDAPENDLDILIADEAHRIRRGKRVPQVDELIRVARVPVFLLDEYQTVRPYEVGSPQMIREAAEKQGVRVHQINLRHQFRCGGSPEYVDWIERILGLTTEPAPPPWTPLDNFDLRVADAPATMEQFLRTKIEQGHTARIAAGFCWPWSDPRSDGTLVDDVVIGDWRRPWNANSREWHHGVPPSDLWATEDGGFGQIGCIYTAQGFEYDYAGVIFGDDLVWRNGRWAATPQANADKVMNGIPFREFNRLIRYVYRVLATRGVRGAVLYSTDPETNDHFRRLGVPSLEG